MKNLSLFFAAILIQLVGSAQESSPNAKVLAAFSTQELSSKTSEEIAYLNFLTENLCSVSDVGEKAADYSNFVFIDKNGNELNPEEELNVLLFPQLEATNQYQYLRIPGTTKVILVQSAARLEVLYQRYQANQKK
jgi:hypothetical protein